MTHTHYYQPSLLPSGPWWEALATRCSWVALSFRAYIPCSVSPRHFHLFLNKPLYNFVICVYFSNTSLIQQDTKNSNQLLSFPCLLGNSGECVPLSRTLFILDRGWRGVRFLYPQTARLTHAALWTLEKVGALCFAGASNHFCVYCGFPSWERCSCPPPSMASVEFLPCV